RRFAQQLIRRRRRGLLRNLERLLDQRAQLLECDRLRQIIEGTGLERGYGVLCATEGGDDRNRHVERLFGDVFDDSESLAVGQSHVGQAEVESLAVEQLDRFADRLCTRRVETHPRQGELEQLEQVGLIVDDQHFRLPAIACSSRHSASQGNSRLGRRVRRPLQRQSKIGARTLGQELERRTVRISKLPGDVQAQPGPARPRREERLEYLRPQLGRNARAVVGKLGYYGIAHISGTAHDVDAAVLLLAVLPCVAHQVPYDLAQVAA